MGKFVFLLKEETDGRWVVKDMHPISPISMLGGRERAAAISHARQFLGYNPVIEDRKAIDRLYLKAITESHCVGQLFCVNSVEPLSQEDLQRLVDLEIEQHGRDDFISRFGYRRDVLVERGMTMASDHLPQAPKQTDNGIPGDP